MREVEKKQFSFDKTVRYYQLGQITKKTKTVYFATHGYGMLAEFFSRKFLKLVDEESVVILPEGMHRFYLQGTSGRVVASWMTKDDREVDIADNKRLLNSVLTDAGVNKNHNIVAIGFSQGVPTLCRWLVETPFHVEKLICWASDIPEDVLNEEGISILNNCNTELVVGDEDEFISEERLEKFTSKLKSKGVDFNLVKYNGTHKIEPELLLKLVK
ncbi:alpha/beta hydrolase [Salibacter halophilus]|uniref:Phospholipase n=1 Tax=Salibacter halophilus TaxID=1803916 RepID=A0A6N6M7A0_9FLAO|nr:phospholipase [Salibacter halophilus]KAB1065930.1 phospholipase [Salibacter halophilus]